MPLPPIVSCFSKILMVYVSDAARTQKLTDVTKRPTHTTTTADDVTTRKRTHTILLLFWNLSGTTRVSRYQKGKTRKVKKKKKKKKKKVPAYLWSRRGGGYQRVRAVRTVGRLWLVLGSRCVAGGPRDIAAVCMTTDELTTITHETHRLHVLYIQHHQPSRNGHIQGVPKKRTPLICFDDNFGKYRPILTFFSLLQQENYDAQKLCYFSHLTFIMLPLDLVKQTLMLVSMQIFLDHATKQN